jgi:hypothetical protein
MQRTRTLFQVIPFKRDWLDFVSDQSARYRCSMKCGRRQHAADHIQWRLLKATTIKCGGHICTVIV